MMKGTGKKKIDIKKITSDSARKVTFSKRRTGLFKKAQELETKTGARVALIVFSPSGRIYTSGDVSLFENNGFSLKPHNSTKIASNSYAKPSTLCLKNFSPDGEFYSSGEFSIVDDNLKNYGFSSKSHNSTEIASNSYAKPSTLRLKNFNVEECSEIFSPSGGLYSSGSPESFLPADGLYSSGEFPIVDNNLKNNGFCSESDLGSDSYGDWNTLLLENLNVEECNSVDELMLLKEKLEEYRDELILKMEAEFIESLLV